MGEFVSVAKANQKIAPGQATCVEVSGKEIALFKIDGVFHAIDNTCTHVGGPLSEGELKNIQVTCPWHGAVFDVTTGWVPGPPAVSAVAKYNTRVAGGEFEIDVPEGTLLAGLRQEFSFAKRRAGWNLS